VFLADPGVDADVRGQYNDNLKWILEAGKNKLVVGSQARILYSDRVGRMSLALEFNEAIRSGVLKASILHSKLQVGSG
jgi:urocanate hydratase